MAKYVIGTFEYATEAENTINRLVDEGYPVDSFTLIGNDSAVSNLTGSSVHIENNMDYDADDETLWGRIKNFFGFDDEDDYTDTLSAHRQDIRDGKILLVVDDALVPESMRGDLQAMDTGYWNGEADVQTETAADIRDVDDETVQLEEERLNVDKEAVEAGEVVLNKRVVEENQTINVPVRHEELVIEREPVTGQPAASADFTGDTITIPLSAEQVHVTKEPIVTEEVHLHKRSVEDNQQVNASVRKEKLDVDKTGNVIVNELPGDNDARV